MKAKCYREICILVRCYTRVHPLIPVGLQEGSGPFALCIEMFYVFNPHSHFSVNKNGYARTTFTRGNLSNPVNSL